MSADALIAELYACANGQGDWSATLTRIADHLDVWTVQVVGIDKRTGHLMFSVHGGQATPETALDYFRYYNTIDPKPPLALATPEGEWFHCHEHFDDSFVAHDPFFQDFLIPHGGRYSSSSVLLNHADVGFALSMLSAAGRQPLTQGAMAAADQFRYHFAQAMRNLVHLRDRYAELGMARELLAQFSYPMVLIDETRGIWHRNVAAQRFFEAGVFAWDQGGLLSCRNRASDAALTQAIHSLELPGPASEAEIARRAVPLVGTDGSRCLAFVSAVRADQAMGAFGHGARALVIFHEPKAPSRRLDPFIVAECFGFTPAETQVAVSIAAGESPKQIAQRTGAALATVRTHLQRVLDKAGVERQVDLVRTLLELPARVH